MTDQTTLPLPARIRFIERDWLSANHIVALDDDGATIVDTGYVKHKHFTAALVTSVVGSRGVKKIMNTHLHSDHCGGNAQLAMQFKCAIDIPIESWKEANEWDESVLTFSLTAQGCDRFAPTGVIAAGDEWHMGGLLWKAYSAPGHDPKSLIFFAPNERILISADALWKNGYGILFPELEELEAVPEQAAILDLIEDLNPLLVLPGHGPMFSDIAPALARARSRLGAMGTDRAKHARNAIKVLMKFLLLDREKVEIAALPTILKDALIMRQSSRLLQLEPMQAITQAYQDLVAAKQLRISQDGLWLLNV